MFRSSTIIRELALNLVKLYFCIKTFGEVTSLFIMRLCGSMSRNGVCAVCKIHSIQCKLPDDG